MIIQDFPEYYHYDSEKQFTYHGIVQYNRNPLVQSRPGRWLEDRPHGCRRLWRGGQRRAHSGRRVIVVLNGMPSKSVRKEESVRMLNWAFATFENVKLFAANDIVENAPVYLGSRPSVPLVGGQDLVLTMPRDWRAHALCKHRLR